MQTGLPRRRDSEHQHQPTRLYIKKMALDALALLLALLAPCAHAQAPLPQPNLTLLDNGSVTAFARQPNGGTIIAGEFTSVDGLPRNGLARVRPDGAVDPDWNPAPDSTVTALAVDANGDVYAGGSFLSIGGVARARLAKLSGGGTGQADALWNPSSDGSVQVLALDGGNALYVGGYFENIGGQQRSGLAKLSPGGSGGADPSWAPVTPGSNPGIDALAVGAGALYVGGLFGELGGQPRSYLAKLALGGSGAADPTWNPSPDNRVQAIALGPTGAVFVAGIFQNIGGRPLIYLAKLSGTGTGAADAVWHPVPERDTPMYGDVEALAVDANGDVYLGGWFAKVSGQARRNIAKVSGTGAGAPLAWNPGADERVLAVDVDALVNVRAAGKFQRIAGQQGWGYATLASNGTVAAAVDAQVPGSADVFATQPDGGFIVGGRFGSANGEPRDNLLRVRTDGTLDPAWKPNADNAVGALAVTAGSVYAGGQFFKVDGLARYRLVKLDGPNAVVDAVWAPDPDGPVHALAVVFGELFVGGGFTTIGHQHVKNLAKLPLADDDNASTTWKPEPDGSVYALAHDGTGELFVAGGFGVISGFTRPMLARVATFGTGTIAPAWAPLDGYSGAAIALAYVAPDTLYVGGGFERFGMPVPKSLAKVAARGSGATDLAWNPQPVYNPADPFDFPTITALATDRTGAVYAAGMFTQIGGAPRDGLVRLSGTTGTAAPWNPAPNGWVNALAPTANGAMLVGGSFTQIGGVTRVGLAAFADADKIFANGFDAP